MVKIKIWRSKDQYPRLDSLGYLFKERYTLIDDTIEVDEDEIPFDDFAELSKYVDSYYFTYQKDKTKKYNYKDIYKSTPQYRHLYFPDVIQIGDKYYMILDVGCTRVDMR